MLDQTIPQTVPDELSKLAAVQAEHEEELLSKQNVVGVAIGNKIKEGVETGDTALTVLVEAKMEKGLLGDDLVKPSIGNIKTDVKEVGIVYAGGPVGPALAPPHGGMIEWTEWDVGNGRTAQLEAAPAEPVREAPPAAVGPLALTQRIRPAMGGYSCGHYRVTAGTIATGCYDWDAFPGVPPRYYLLTNNHVAANSNNAAIGDPILQPGRFDGGAMPNDVIGRLARFVAIQFKPPAPTPVPINYVDAAIAEVDFHSLDREIYYIGRLRRLYAQPRPGDVVQKTGRTTSFTTGIVTDVNATIDVNYGGGRVARFRRQILARTRDGRAMGAPGDSGSLVSNLEEEGVGLLFAGSSLVTVINHLHYVQALLRVRVTEL